MVEETIAALDILTKAQRETEKSWLLPIEVRDGGADILANARRHLRNKLMAYLTGGPDEPNRNL